MLPNQLHQGAASEMLSDEKIKKSLCWMGWKLEFLEEIAERKRSPVSGMQFRRQELLDSGRCLNRGSWRSFRTPYVWWEPEYITIRATVSPPAGFDLKNVNLVLDFRGLEMLLRVNGRSFCGFDTFHKSIRLPFGPGREPLEIELECSILAVRAKWEALQPPALLKGIWLVESDPVLMQLVHDLRIALEAAQARQEKEVVVGFVEAMNAALGVVDPSSAVDERDVEKARSILNERLVELRARHREDGLVLMIAHSHLDTAYLWAIKETIRKCSRTFSSMMRLMEQYPQFTFSASAPQHLQFVEQHDPLLFSEIVKRVHEGRWEPLGGMWVESDCNIPSGESLARQFLQGRKFYREKLGTEVNICWLPDVFGFNGNLPQIMKKSGIAYFLTTKLYWQKTNTFPYRVFWWEGIDGTRVLAHLPFQRDIYTGLMTPASIQHVWEHHSQKDAVPISAYLWGWGDGGGGPTADMVEAAERMNTLPGLPETRLATAQQFFRELEKFHDLPVHKGELYLETHRGTLTTQTWIKKANRRMEDLYRHAETFASLAGILSGKKINLAELQQGWRDLLLHQFHDILPGTSIGETYRVARQVFSEIEARGKAVLREALASLLPAADGGGTFAVVANPLAVSRHDPVFILGDAESAIAPDGTALPSQRVTTLRGERGLLVQPMDEVPGWSWWCFQLTSTPQPVKNELRVSERSLDNRFFRIRLNRCGHISSLFDKRLNREMVKQGKRIALWRSADWPHNESAWNIDRDSLPYGRFIEEIASVEVVESGPVRAAIRLTYEFGKSQIVQDIRIYAELPRIDFATTVNWQERNLLLKAVFPLTVRCSRATFETAYGAQQRPTNPKNRFDREKWEVSMHRWVDLSQRDFGCAVLNDSKYGCDVREATLRITLLRSPSFPDPNADRGEHQFTYSLLPHEGDWTSTDVVQQAAQLNEPYYVTMTASPAGSLPPAVKVSPANVLATVLKPSEDGAGYLLRLYESIGRLTEASIAFAWRPASVFECNLLEEERVPVTLHGQEIRTTFGPFEIKSFYLGSDIGH